MWAEPIDILLVEDDAVDVELTREALSESKIKVTLNVVRDGERAMSYLRKEEPYAAAATPDLVILDLNLPRMNGQEVLQAMKSDEHLKKIPVVVLTTSSDKEDIARSYALGANCYVTKPMGLDQFSQVVHSIETFWFTIVRLPEKDG
jgi:two-component system response regulator